VMDRGGRTVVPACERPVRAPHPVTAPA
jgi:hypothetical protein